MKSSELVSRALEVRAQYAAWEERKYGRSWTPEEIALFLCGGSSMRSVSDG